jgi:AcrR family transcriptional regulator
VSQVTAYRDEVQLTRGRIITAAMDLIEAEGLEAVSMTRLATELGCGLIPLYSHVPSTAALLDGIAATITSGHDAGPQASAGVGWADQIRMHARAIRQASRAYPRCGVAVAGRKPVTDAMLRPTEQALAILRTAGFGGSDSVRIERAVAAYLTGSLVREVGGADGLSDGLDGLDGNNRRPRLRPAEFPQITSLAAELVRADPEADFELGLDLLVRGMTALLAVRAGG